MVDGNVATLKGKKVIVLGLGVSGRAAARFLLQKDAHVVAVDDRAAQMGEDLEVMALAEQGLTLLKPGECVATADLVVVSPGVPPKHPFIQQAYHNRWEVIGEVELASRFLSQRMLGVTGTNGKTSVTLLVAHVLQSAGVASSALGNVGTPLSHHLSALKAPYFDEVLVVELSSYQLETMQTRCLDAAVVLNVTADHLDRYQGMNEYAAVKMRISACLKPEGPFYVEEKCARAYPSSIAKTYGYHPASFIHTDLEHVYVEGIPEFSLPASMQGRISHEVENLMAAYALCRVIGVTGAQFIGAYATYVKPSHRIEFVRAHKGVSYIDDSKGTNLDAVIRAVNGMNEPVVLIAGGVDKGASYTPWIQAFAGKVRCICAIGQAAKKIESEIGTAIPTSLYKDLGEAVQAAAQMANPGETVLLSPGCASFDMFKDYMQRGDEFKRIVQAL